MIILFELIVKIGKVTINKTIYKNTYISIIPRIPPSILDGKAKITVARTIFSTIPLILTIIAKINPNIDNNIKNDISSYNKIFKIE